MLGILLAATATAGVAAPPEEGSRVPDIVLSVLDGGEATLSEQVGEGPVILVFFRGAW